MKSIIKFHIHISFRMPQLSSWDLYGSIFPHKSFSKHKVRNLCALKKRQEEPRYIISWEWHGARHSANTNTVIQASKNIQSSRSIVYKSDADPNSPRLDCSSESPASGIMSQQTGNAETHQPSLLFFFFPLQIMLAASGFSATFALFQVELTILRSPWAFSGKLTVGHGCLS